MYSSGFIAVAVSLLWSLHSGVAQATSGQAGIGLDTPAGAKAASLVFFWNGDEISTLYPNANIADVAARYQLRGLRVVQAFGLPPQFFRQFVAMDRKAHPADYRGKRVTLVIHGHGIRSVPKTIEIKKELATIQAGAMPVEPMALLQPAATPSPIERVKDEEIILSFIEGIGEQAKAETISSACFFGHECFAVSLADTTLAARVSLLMIPRRTSRNSLSELIPAPTGESVLTRLSTILLPHSK